MSKAQTADYSAACSLFRFQTVPTVISPTDRRSLSPLPKQPPVAEVMNLIHDFRHMAAPFVIGIIRLCIYCSDIAAWCVLLVWLPG